MSSKDDLRFTKVLEQDSNEAFADLQKNRTILMAKLTDSPATSPDIVQDLTTMNDVFDHYKPEVDVEFEDGAGKEVKEKLKFSKLDQFGKKGLIAQSPFLLDLDVQQENYKRFTQRLKGNKTLQKLLTNQEAKANYIAALRSMIAELQQSEQ